MRKMLVLSLVLSVMAVGSAMANSVNSADMRGPRKVNVTINMPPCNCVAHPARPHGVVYRECPPPCNHHAGKAHRPAPRFNNNRGPAKPHGEHGRPGPGNPAGPGNHGPAPRR